MADSKLEIILSAKDQTAAAFSSLKSNLTGVSQASTQAGSAFSQVGKIAAGVFAGNLITSGIQKLAEGFTGVVKAAANFESGMSAVEAASRASSSEMSQLSTLALSLGSDLQLAGVDATDAATAMEGLSKGGVSVADQLGGATKGALLLYSAGAKDVASATDTAVKAMNIFNLTGADVAHVADLMAAGAGKSATDVEQLGQAFNQSAAVAKSAGLSIETLTGTLAFLAQRGMEGSDAGTSLKTAILALQAPTDTAAATMRELGINVRDANGHMLPFSQIADVLKTKLSGLSDAQRDAALKTIFGNDAIRVGIALYEGGGTAITDWTTKVNDAGYAAEVGAIRNNNLKGAFEQLKATIQTGAIVFGKELTPALKTATDAGTKFISDFVASPAMQEGAKRFGADLSTAITSIVTKLQDPAFQTQARQWATALLDIGKAATSLAGDVKNTLGPVVTSAVKWFGDLDEGGKKNVVTFALVAGAAFKFRDELGSLLSVGNSVIKMFAAKEAAKKTLTTANEVLAGSAGRTAAAFGVVRTAAAAAAPEIAAAAVITAGSVLAAGGAALGFAVLANKMDEGGQRAKDFTLAQEAMNLAMQNGAARGSDLNTNFVAYVQNLPVAVTNTDQLAQAWNRYVAAQTAAGNGTTGLTVALTAQQQAQQGVNKYLGEGLLSGQQYSTVIGGMTIATNALAATLPSINQGLAGAAIAAASLAVPVQTSALALQELNSYGTSSQAALNNVASGALAASQNLAAVTTQAQNYATAQAIAEGDTGEFGTALGILSGKIIAVGNSFASTTAKLQGLNSEHGTLSGWLQTLQTEWDGIDAAIKKAGNTTAAQTARQQELAPTIEAINGLLGTNATQTTNATLEAFKLWQQQQGLNTAYGTTSAAVNTQNSAMVGMTSAVAAASITNAAHTVALNATKWAINGASDAALANTISTNDSAAAIQSATINARDYRTALINVPSTVSTKTETPGLSEAINGVSNYISSLNSIPRNITTTVTTNYQSSGSPGSSNLLADIPAFAKGGIVNRPTLALIGERGPEAVVPLGGNFAPPGFGTGRNSNSNTGGGVTNQYTFQMYGDVYDAASFQDRVIGTIEDATRRGRQ